MVRERPAILPMRCPMKFASLLLLPALAGLWPSAIAGAAAPRPNVILMMSDDQGWGDVGFNGHPVRKTGHLDARACDWSGSTRRCQCAHRRAARAPPDCTRAGIV